MSRKFFVIYLIVLALVLAGLIAAYAVTGTAAVVRERADLSGNLPFANSMGRHPELANSQNLVGPDWGERHPNGLRSKYLVGPDWAERHPAGLVPNTLVGPDWGERHLDGLIVDLVVFPDWGERHPNGLMLDDLAGYDRIEQNPSFKFHFGSD